MSWTKTLLVNTGLIILSVSLVVVAFELSLRTGLFDDLDNPGPVWIPPKYKEADEEIFNRNEAFALDNPFWFNDIVRIPRKMEGITRIAVLGDSFIQGDGLPYEKVWSYKLEGALQKDYPFVEVLHWGRNGWNTADELEFLTRFGKDYNIDYLIVGFVTNDPDMNNTMRDKGFLQWHKSESFKLFKNILPLTSDFLSAHVNNLLTRYIYNDNKYAAGDWLEDLYAPDNLKLYSETLKELSAYCKSKSIPLLFVLTPRTYSESIQLKYDKVIPLLKEADIAYLNLLPKIQRTFEGVNPRTLWANPANSHPGDKLTDLFAEDVFKQITNKWLSEKEDIPYAYRSPIAGLSENYTECALLIKAFGDRKDPKFPISIEINREGHIFIEGDAGQFNNHKPVKSVYIKVNNSDPIETIMGPFYEAHKFIPDKTQYNLIQNSWLTFKAHLPAHYFQKGKNLVEFVFERNDINAYTIYPTRFEVIFSE